MQRHTILLEALEPISHGDTVTGLDNATNTRLFMRSALLLDGRGARVPDISENSIRSAMVREPLHDHLLQALGIGPGELPRAATNLLYSGGDMGAGSRAPGDEFTLGHQVRALYPSLDLLGGAVDSFILPRSRLRLAAWPLAREFARLLSYVDEAAAEEAAAAPSIFDLVYEETRTRGTSSTSDGNQMLYTYETLAAGTRILVECTMDPHTPAATAGALTVAVRAWPGYFGGQGRQGRGRMAVVRDDLPAAQPYLDHIAEHKEAMLEGLRTGRLGTEKVLCAS